LNVDSKGDTNISLCHDIKSHNFGRTKLNIVKRYIYFVGNHS